MALGGDGFTSPKGMYTITNFLITGDGTAGSKRLEIIMDPDYCSMVGYASMTEPSTALMDLRWTLVGAPGGAVPLQVRVQRVVNISTSVGVQISDMWLPPATINPGTADQVPTLAIQIANVDLLVMQMHAVIFTYDIRAREDARYAALVAARGGI